MQTYNLVGMTISTVYGDLDNDTVDGVPDLYVGRLPASTTDEASTLVDKIVNYSPINEWFMKSLLLGTDPFKFPPKPWIRGAEGEILKDYIEDNFVWAVIRGGIFLSLPLRVSSCENHS